MPTVRAKYRGYARYYGLIGNSRSLNQYGQQTQRILLKWLNRRSQRRSFTWSSYRRMLDRFRVELPKIWERSRGLVHDLSRWAEENAEQLSQVQLAGRHYRPCGCASELR